MFHGVAAAPYWEQENLPPFDELMISWNGFRPVQGSYSIFARVQIGSWSPWLLYGSWGAEGQSSFDNQVGSVRVYQDAFEVLGGEKARGFQVRVEPGAALRLHVYTNSASQPSFADSYEPVHLQMDGLSQMTLGHPRHLDLCSPTAASAVLRYLKKQIDPIHFAGRVWDQRFDIFGNWALNVAEASNHLGLDWDVWVERLSGFSDIYRRLLLKTPVIVSVRGPLPGSARPYAKGHLIVVNGFDPQKKEVHCMDPGFPTDDQAHVQYGLEDFVTAWNRRGNIAYIFQKKYS